MMLVKVQRTCCNQVAFWENGLRKRKLSFVLLKTNASLMRDESEQEINVRVVLQCGREGREEGDKEWTGKERIYK